MTARKIPQRSAIAALLGATALHLALIAAAVVWLAAPAGPDRREPILIVALHREVTTPPAPATARASRPAAPPQAMDSAPAPPRPLPQRRLRAAAPKSTSNPPEMATAPDTPSTAPPLAPSDPPATPAPDAPPAAKPEAPVAKTGVAIPAAYAARNRKPDYPLLSRRYNEQGTAVLRVLVNADGTAGAVQIKQSSGYPLLDQAALAAAREWRFVAATQDGKPVAEWYEISIPYTLQD